MIILKGKVPHTTHSYTKHSQKKKWKRKTAKKAKCTSIKQQQAKAWTKLSDNLYSVPSTEEAHELNRRFWDSKYRKMYLLQGLQGKQRLWRHRWVVAILLYSGRSRPSDKGRGVPGHPDPEIRRGVSKKNYPALRAQSQFGLKIRGRPGPPRLLPYIRHCYIQSGLLTIALLQFPKMSFA